MARPARSGSKVRFGRADLYPIGVDGNRQISVCSGAMEQMPGQSRATLR